MWPCLGRHGKHSQRVHSVSAVRPSMWPCLGRHGKDEQELPPIPPGDPSMWPCLGRHGKAPLGNETSERLAASMWPCLGRHGKHHWFHSVFIGDERSPAHGDHIAARRLRPAQELIEPLPLDRWSASRRPRRPEAWVFTEGVVLDPVDFTHSQRGQFAPIHILSMQDVE